MEARIERLFAAIQDENLAATIKELDRGTDVDSKDAWGDTPLHEAARHRYNSKIAQTLIDRGANVNARNRKGITPLHESRSPITTKLLLDSGAYPGARDKNGTTVMQFVIRNSVLHSAMLEIVLMLMDAGAEVDTKNYLEETVFGDIEKMGFDFLKDAIEQKQKGTIDA